jgi:uncharacterized membrane protein (DUF485 family)
METLMQQNIVDKVKSNPKYAELVRSRSTLGWVLSILVMLIYYGFILVIAFNKALLAQPLYPGTVITVGIPVGVSVIVLSFILTGIYVWRANSKFDELTKQIKQEIR